MSYVTVSKEEVLEMCNTIISRIEAKHNKVKEQRIYEVMHEHKGSWIRKLFGMKTTRTREEAIKILKSRSYFEEEYRNIEGLHSYQLNTARMLIKAVECSASPTIQVSLSDLYYIKC